MNVKSASTRNLFMPPSKLAKQNKSRLKLTFDVVTVAEAAKLLLASSVPDVEFDRAAVGVEH